MPEDWRLGQRQAAAATPYLVARKRVVKVRAIDIPYAACIHRYRVAHRAANCRTPGSQVIDHRFRGTVFLIASAAAEPLRTHADDPSQSTSKCAFRGLLPQIEVMSCGQAEKQITRSISARMTM